MVGRWREVGRMDELAGMDSPVHRLDARIKALVTLLFIVAVMSFGRYEVSALVPFALYPVAMGAAARIPARDVFRKMLVAAPFAVAVGMDIKHIYLHDPLYTNPADGEAHAYPLEIFWQAWKETASDTKYPGPERAAIIPTGGIGFRLARKVMVKQASLNIRSGPGVNFPVVGSAKKGEIYEITREMGGWGAISEDRWFALQYTQAA